MNLSKCKKCYENILYKNPDNKGYYFKTTVENLYESSVLQKGLLTSLFFLSQLQDELYTKDELKMCIY